MEEGFMVMSYTQQNCFWANENVQKYKSLLKPFGQGFLHLHWQLCITYVKGEPQGKAFGNSEEFTVKIQTSFSLSQDIRIK